MTPGIDMASITNEGLAIEIKNLSVQIADLKAVMATNAADYVRKEVFELRMRELDNEQERIRLEIENVRSTAKADFQAAKTQANKANWKSHTLTAFLTATLVFLTQYFLSNVGG